MRSFPQTFPSAVILDMDGTTVRHHDERWINLAEWLDDRTHFLSKSYAFLFARNTLDPEHILNRIEAEIPHKAPALRGHRCLHWLREKRKKDVDDIVCPSPHVRDFLEALQALSIPTGLASNGLGQGYGHEVLKIFDLEKYFQATVFREDIRRSKPNPEGILLALKNLDLGLKSDAVVWYIGDRPKDITAALTADRVLPYTIVPIAYTDKAAKKATEEGLSAEHIIKSYDTLKDLILSLSNTTEKRAP